MANIQSRNALVSFGRVTWIAALLSVVSCHDAPSADRAPEWVVLSAHEETQSPALLFEDHLPADLIQPQERQKIRAAAVKAHQQTPSVASGAALARAYFPEFAFSELSNGGGAPEKQTVRDAQRLSVRTAPGQNALELQTRGYVFRIQSQAGIPAAIAASGEVSPAGEHHFFAPVDQVATASGDWRTSRLEEYWVRDVAAGYQRAEYEITLPAGVRRIRDAGEYLEFLDHHDLSVLRFHASVVRDAEGRTRTGTIRLAGVERTGSRLYAAGEKLHVSTEVSLDGLAAPLVVDPGWSSTMSMASGRCWHTTTLLPTGKVLAVGGYDGTRYLASTELFDPDTNTWSSGGELAVGRGSHTASLLSTGRVMVVGGSGGTAALASTEIYDPAANTWTSGPSLSIGRWSASAVLLASGKLLVAGGSYTDASAELFDPVAGTWSPAGSLVRARTHATATLLATGEVLLVAGMISSGMPGIHSVGPWTDVDIYDPAANRWTRGPSIPSARSGHTATLLPSGKVLVASGWNDPNSGTIEPSVRLYDPMTKSWSTAGNLTTMRTTHTATLLPSGQVLVAGGYAHISGVGSSAELYSPSTDKWASTGTLVGPRTYHTATLLPSGQVLVTGGQYGGSYLASSELYDPGINVWTATAPMVSGHQHHAATLLPSGEVLVMGGRSSSATTSSPYAEKYNPTSKAWTAVAGMKDSRGEHTATLLPSGKVLVTGGGTAISAEVYDPGTDTWEATGSMLAPRRQHCAVLLLSGKVLVVGGEKVGGNPTAAEVYDPDTNAWSPAGSMLTSRVLPSATLLPSGKVLVAGGSSPVETSLSSAELYDPTTGTWTSAANMKTPRYGHTATLLPTGKVLVAGGMDATGLYREPAELYDPESDIWTSAGNMPTLRAWHTATLLLSGRVLVADGVFISSQTPTRVVTYDPATNTWASAGNMTARRVGQTATLLPTGLVLLAGGSSATAELYDDRLAQDAWRPVVTGPAVLRANQSATMSGAGFRGLSGMSGGNFADSSTAFPFVQFRSLDGERTWRLPASQFSATSFTIKTPAEASPGYYLLSVLANAIPGGLVVRIESNTPSIAQDVATTTTANTPVTVTLSAVDPDGGSLSYRVVTPSAHGSASGTGASLSYSPASDYVGTDSFTYVANDGTADSNIATVTITVLPSAPAIITVGDGASVATHEVSVSGTVLPNAVVTIFDGSTSIGTITADGSGAFSGTFTFTTGAHSLSATQTVNGLTSTLSAVVHFNVANQSPPVLSNMPADMVVEATSHNGAAVSWTMPTAVDENGGSLTVTCLPAAGSTFPIDARQVTCTATSAAGISTSATFSVTVRDTTAPTIQCPARAEARAIGTNGTAVVFELPTAADLVTEHPTVKTDRASGSLFPIGETSVTATATDESGNAATCQFVVSVKSARTNAAPVARDSMAMTTANAPTTVTFSALDPEGDSLSYRVVNAPAHGTTSGTGSTLQYVPALDYVGMDSFTYVANDGLAESNTATVSVIVAPSAPTITTPDDGASVATREVRLSGKALPNALVTLFDGSTLIATMMADGAGSFTGASVFANGAHVLTATQTVNGLASPSSAAMHFTVVDEKAPIISNMPTDLIVEATSSRGAVVSWTAPTALDGKDGPLMVTCAPASRSTFPIGSQQVTCTATNAAGNSASAVFTVTVRDTTAPVIKCPGRTEAVTSDANGASTSFETPTAFDVVTGHPTVSVDHDSSSLFPVGETEVTATATDEAGNSATCRFVVAVTERATDSGGATVNPGCGGCSSGNATSGILLLGMLLIGRRRRQAVARP